MPDAITTALGVYGGVGSAVALIFLVYGMDRIDAAAKGAYAMRPLLVPGLVILWPIVILRWIALERAQGRQP